MNIVDVCTLYLNELMSLGVTAYITTGWKSVNILLPTI